MRKKKKKHFMEKLPKGAKSCFLNTLALTVYNSTKHLSFTFFEQTKSSVSLDTLVRDLDLTGCAKVGINRCHVLIQRETNRLVTTLPHVELSKFCLIRDAS